MTSIRQEKFSRLIQKEISYFFLTGGKRLFKDLIISVTKVNTSPDLNYVKIYVNFLNAANPGKVVELLNQHNHEIRRELGARIRKEVRKIPELTFFYDDTLDYMEKMDHIFKEIHDKETNKPDQSPENQS